MNSDREWRLVQETYSPAMHMALDEELTDRLASGETRPTLRIWEWPTPAVVIGRFQALKDEVFEPMAKKNNIEIVRRMTGGGAMFTEPKNVITYSLTLPEDMLESNDILGSYRELEQWSVQALTDIGIDAEHKPVNDIITNGRKIGGSAQARRDGVVLHHTMMAYDIDIKTMLQVLKIGKEKISDKAIKSAAKRVAPISENTDLSRDEVLEQMISRFSEQTPLQEDSLSQATIKNAEQRVKDKYGTDEWLYRVQRQFDETT
ncbi:MAG: lipoate--protein ligase family protein [Candidatus Nanohaloarchaeota archaeon QJJ-5]|nr:lipoate--protein ligase family protein [Candidatus Nanohaloarchaeota archaeon QJJ-5]